MSVRTERSSGLEVSVTRAASVLLIMAGLVLGYPAVQFAQASRLFWAVFWGLGALAFVGFGVATLLYLSRRLAPPRRALLRPVLLLGSIAAALAGAGWALDTLVRWQHSGDLEAYGVVLGLVLALQGSLTFLAVERGGPGAVR
jgi:hypothetical protein